MFQTWSKWSRNPTQHLAGSVQFYTKNTPLKGIPCLILTPGVNPSVVDDPVVLRIRVNKHVYLDFRKSKPNLVAFLGVFFKP